MNQIKESIIQEAQLLMQDHTSKDVRWFAKSVCEYLTAEQPAQDELKLTHERIAQLEAESMRMQGRELKLQFALAKQPAQQEHTKQEFIDKLNGAFSPLARNHYKWDGWPGTNLFALAAWDAVGAQTAEQPAQQQQEPATIFGWLPEGATHLGHISVRVCAGGSLEMHTNAFKYDRGVLKVYVTDNDNEYPGWRDAKDVFFHLNFPVIPLYTSPPTQRKPLTDEQQFAEALRPHGLTLVKTSTGYHVMKLGQITAHGITGEQK